jgi:hypothetical protein
MCVVAVGTVCGVGRRVSGLLGLEGPCLRAVKSGLVVVVSRVCGDTVCAHVCMCECVCVCVCACVYVCFGSATVQGRGQA